MLINNEKDFSQVNEKYYTLVNEAMWVILINLYGSYHNYKK